jgi:hypothetical protein
MTASDTPPPLTDEELQDLRDWHRKTLDPKVGRLLAKVDALLAHNGVLVTEVRFQAERAEAARADRNALAAKLHAVDAVLNAHAEGRDPMGLCMELGSTAMRIAGLIATARTENTALAAAVKTIATALDNLGGRIYRDLRDEYDDIAERVGADDAKMLRAFNDYAEEQLAVLNNPAVRAALGETGGTDAG